MMMLEAVYDPEAAKSRAGAGSHWRPAKWKMKNRKMKVLKVLMIVKQ